MNKAELRFLVNLVKTYERTRMPPAPAAVSVGDNPAAREIAVLRTKNAELTDQVHALDKLLRTREGQIAMDALINIWGVVYPGCFPIYDVKGGFWTGHVPLDPDGDRLPRAILAQLDKCAPGGPR